MYCLGTITIQVYFDPTSKYEFPVANVQVFCSAGYTEYHYGTVLTALYTYPHPNID
jgi:hypothetical protein